MKSSHQVSSNHKLEKRDRPRGLGCHKDSIVTRSQCHQLKKRDNSMELDRPKDLIVTRFLISLQFLWPPKVSPLGFNSGLVSTKLLATYLVLAAYLPPV